MCQLNIWSLATAHSSLTRALSHCTQLMELYLCYCLPKPAPSDDTPQGTCWLYDLITSISSRKLRYLSFRLDARQLDVSNDDLYKIAQEFLDQQNATWIDAILSDTRRFERLRVVRCSILCSTQTRLSPDQKIWRAAIGSRFPQLQSRRILG